MVVAVTAVAAVTTVAVVTGGTAVAAGAGGGAAVGGTAVGALAGEAATAATTFLVAAGPVGWIALGADGVTWDCWRDILHDYETPAERGRLLKDVAGDRRVVEIRAAETEGYWPQLWLKNQWDETFRIDYVQFPDGEIAAHATLA